LMSITKNTTHSIQKKKCSGSIRSLSKLCKKMILKRILL
jgi:hypothetical protein